jgi:hypothetical protein
MFIVLFEKSSTLIDLMDLCKDFIIKEEMCDKPSLNGLGVLHLIWTLIMLFLKKKSVIYITFFFFFRILTILIYILN